MNAEEVSAIVVDAAFHLHQDVGPGLLEGVYEVMLARILEDRGLQVQRQKVVAIEYKGMRFDEGFRVDLLVQGCLVVELKSVQSLSPVHSKQVLTYLRMLDLSLGLLINFGSDTFRKGIKRIANGHVDLESSRLRVNREAAGIRSRTASGPDPA